MSYLSLRYHVPRPTDFTKKQKYLLRLKTVILLQRNKQTKATQ